MTKKETGEYGETVAARFLETKGFRITGRNVHSRYGEIDIIGENDEYILFVEAKTRSANRWGTPSEAVHTAKQKKIIKTALVYLSEHPCALQPRFDVIEVMIENGKTGIQWLPNAFDAEIMANEGTF